MSPAEVGPCTPEEFWGDYEAHTGLTPPAHVGPVWRDRGAIIAAQQARIAQLEQELDAAKKRMGDIAQYLINEATTARDVQARSVLLAASRAVDQALASVGRNGGAPAECLSHAHVPWNNWCSPNEAS